MDSYTSRGFFGVSSADESPALLNSSLRYADGASAADDGSVLCMVVEMRQPTIVWAGSVCGDACRNDRSSADYDAGQGSAPALCKVRTLLAIALFARE